MNEKDMFASFASKLLGVEVVREYKFHETRKWRFDYAIIDKKIAIEVEGGIWVNGRHIRGSGFEKDMEKYNEGTALGWRIIRVTPQELLTSKTTSLIQRLL